MLVEGMSMRSVSRTANVSINTVAKLLTDAGNACATYHDNYVQNVNAKRVECNEIIIINIYIYNIYIIIYNYNNNYYVCPASGPAKGYLSIQLATCACSKRLVNNKPV